MSRQKRSCILSPKAAVAEAEKQNTQPTAPGEQDYLPPPKENDVLVPSALRDTNPEEPLTLLYA